MACRRFGDDVCLPCRRTLVEAPDRLLQSGLLVRSGFRHAGSARSLVHAFKYQGSDRAGWFLARAVALLVPGTGVLVPLPRASWRTLTYGIDPAFDLARRVSRLTGLETWGGLSPPVVKPGQAGRSKSERDPPTFGVGSEPPQGELILIDDVITTGRTMTRAEAVLDAFDRRIVLAVSATATCD